MAYGPIRAAYKDRNRDALVTNNEAAFVSYAGLKVDNWVNSH